ncbi:putative uncharacterized protein DDB_G0271982 [Oncorhynchus kisutch]|uniref:putative uncharacterized protein DDB_G0271982 n=1 Tax=Oncorhynchus kisutch TaxID=8019 RepID=UPI0012DD9870|nr:putative uncharacterized protein DDB_G0271982 [Oncorhynchus kisutch]
MALEREREREREEQRLCEEKARLREREREREKEIELARECEREIERQGERERESLSTARDLYNTRNQPQAYQKNQPHSCPHLQAQIEAPHSAFHPVKTPLLQGNQAPHQGYLPYGYTPTEEYPVPSQPLPREQTQINRKFSLTERTGSLFPSERSSM